MEQKTRRLGEVRDAGTWPGNTPQLTSLIPRTEVDGWRHIREQTADKSWLEHLLLILCGLGQALDAFPRRDEAAGRWLQVRNSTGSIYTGSSTEASLHLNTHKLLSTVAMNQGVPGTFAKIYSKEGSKYKNNIRDRKKH